MIDDGHYDDHMMGWMFDGPYGWVLLVIGGVLFLFVVITLIFALSQNPRNDYEKDEIGNSPTQYLQKSPIMKDGRGKIPTTSFCPTCGEKLDGRNLKFCPFCGSKI